MQQQIQAMAQQFGVDANSLTSLIGFLKDNLSKPDVAEIFAEATPEHRDLIIRQGVKAWHERSERIFTDLLENRTEWAQAARKQIASDVWHQARAQGAAA